MKFSFLFWGAFAALLVVFAAKWDSAQRRPPHQGSPCAGGPPDYCANATQATVPETPMAPPAVNTPFHDPDFGSLMVRVTDANTLASVNGGYYIGFSYMTDPSGEANTWSKFDPALGAKGGYRFVIYNTGGWAIPFMLDASTMHVSRIVGKHAGPLSRDGMFTIGGMSFSYLDPDVFYALQGTRLVAYHFSTNRAKPLYDFSRCSNLPAYVRGYQGAVSNSGDDQKFAYYVGGAEQGHTTLVTYYDRSANNSAGGCYWYDTVTGMVGGTNMTAQRVANGTGQLLPPQSPKVVAKAGSGSLPAGDYYVKLTALTRMNPKDGETTPSAEAGPIHLAASGELTITFPKISDPEQLDLPGHGCQPRVSLVNCTPFNVYIGAAPGAERLQTTSGPVGGTSYTQSATLKARSMAPPAASNAGYNVHNARISKGGEFVRVDAQRGETLYFWRAGTNQVTTCGVFYSNCGGHLAMGYSHMINAPNGQDMAEMVIRSFADPAHTRQLVQPLPSPRQWNDSHWSWNDANLGDSMPVCGAFFNSHAQGNGTLDARTNPLLQVTRAYDREIVCVATAGPSRVWRFAHNRSSSASNDQAGSGSSWPAIPIGNVSQDGNFYLFGSDWGWSLGDSKGSRGCPSRGTCRTDIFIVQLH